MMLQSINRVLLILIKIERMLSQSSRNIKSYSELATKERERNYGIHVKRIEEIINKESKIK